MRKMVEKNEERDNKSFDLEINIVPLLLYLLKNLWIILLVGIVTGALAFAGTKIFVKPTYRCSFTAYVNNKLANVNTDGLTQSDVSAAKQLVQTYSTVLTSNNVMSEAIKSKGLSYDVNALKGMVSTEIQPNTEIIKVYVVAKSPEDAFEAAVAIAGVSPKVMADIIEGSSMKIVEYPQMPDGIYTPDYKKYVILGFGAGVLLTLIILVILYLKNDTVKSESELENRFSVPVLGVIPDVNSVSNGKSGYYYYYESKEKEEPNSEKE